MPCQVAKEGNNMTKITNNTILREILTELKEIKRIIRKDPIILLDEFEKYNIELTYEQRKQLGHASYKEQVPEFTKDRTTEGLRECESCGQHINPWTGMLEGGEFNNETGEIKGGKFTCIPC